MFHKDIWSVFAPYTAIYQPPEQIWPYSLCVGDSFLRRSKLECHRLVETILDSRIYATYISSARSGHLHPCFHQRSQSVDRGLFGRPRIDRVPLKFPMDCDPSSIKLDCDPSSVKWIADRLMDRSVNYLNRKD